MKIKNISKLTAVSALAIAGIIVINIILSLVGGRVNLKIDLTKDSLLSFSSATTDTLKSLDQDVKMYSLIPEADSSDLVLKIKEVIEKYAKLSSHIKYENVDTDVNPQFVQKYVNSMTGQTSISQYSVIFETDKRFKVVNLNDAIITDSTGQMVQSLGAEKLFTTAIMYVTSDNTVKIGVVEGHGEMASSSYFDAILKEEGYEVNSLNLLVDTIPEDMNMIIISTPEKDYSNEELDKIDAYLNRGNSLQLLMPPTGKSFSNLEGYLKKWGIEFKSGFVAEGDSNHYYQSQVYIMPQIMESSITEGIIDGKMMLLFPGCRGIKGNSNKDITEEVLLTTTDKAITKSSFDENIANGEIKAESGDAVEKSNIAVILNKKLSEEKSVKIFVSGGINFIQQSLLESNFANKDFYMNTIAYMTENQSLVYIRAKDVSIPIISMSAMQGILYGIVTVIVIPLVFIILAIAVWLKRRHL